MSRSPGMILRRDEGQPLTESRQRLSKRILFNTESYALSNFHWKHSYT